MIASALGESPIGFLTPLVSAGNGPRAGTRNGDGADSDRWQSVIGEIARLKQLPNDWDGQGAARIDPANLARGFTFVEHMRVWPQALPPDQVVPGVTGEVLFVWQRPGVLVEAEIADSNHIEWLVAVDGLPSRCWQTNLDETWLVALIPHVLRSANGMAPP